MIPKSIGSSNVKDNLLLRHFQSSFIPLFESFACTSRHLSCSTIPPFSSYTLLEENCKNGSAVLIDEIVSPRSNKQYTTPNPVSCRISFVRRGYFSVSRLLGRGHRLYCAAAFKLTRIYDSTRVKTPGSFLFRPCFERYL